MKLMYRVARFQEIPTPNTSTTTKNFFKKLKKFRQWTRKMHFTSFSQYLCGKQVAHSGAHFWIIYRVAAPCSPHRLLCAQGSISLLGTLKERIKLSNIYILFVRSLHMFWCQINVRHHYAKKIFQENNTGILQVWVNFSDLPEM